MILVIISAIVACILVARRTGTNWGGAMHSLKNAVGIVVATVLVLMAAGAVAGIVYAIIKYALGQ